jgi:hypothetical protein
MTLMPPADEEQGPCQQMFQAATGAFEAACSLFAIGAAPSESTSTIAQGHLGTPYRLHRQMCQL